MRMSLILKAALVVVAAVGVAGYFMWDARISASEKSGPETLGGFTMNGDGSRLAYHFASAVPGGKGLASGVRVHDTNGKLLYQIVGAPPLRLFAPVFARDGNSLIVATACYSEACGKDLNGSRLVRVDLGSGQKTVLTDAGEATPFWSFDYIEEIPALNPRTVRRTEPVLIDGEPDIFYLMAAATPRDVPIARDFAVRRLSGNGQDEWMLANLSAPVGFRGAGSIAPFGPKSLIVMSGPLRGGLHEDESRDARAFAYSLDPDRREIANDWGGAELDQIALNAVPQRRSLTGVVTKAIAYFGVGARIIQITPTGLQIFTDTPDSETPVWDLAASGDGKALLVVKSDFADGFPAFAFAIYDTLSKSRTPLELTNTGGAAQEFSIK